MAKKEPIITWRNLPRSEAVDAIIRDHAAKLQQFHPRIIGCTVVVDAPDKRRANARGFDVRVHIDIPGPDLDVHRSIRQGTAEDDVIRAVNSAFSAIQKRLKEQHRKMAGRHVKHHPPELHGEIVELEPRLGWGYLRADDGREVYFQRDSLVKGDWDALAPGDRLHFREREGDKGAFATDVAARG